MCGRYINKALGPELNQHGRTMPNPFRTLSGALAEIEFNGDVRPSQFVPVITSLDEDVIPLMQWWYVPPWAKNPDAFRKKLTTFNARIEGVATARTYATSWKGGKRCLFPMGGYYEWQPIAGEKKKQRFNIAPKDGRWMWAAGLWSQTPLPEGPPLYSATMIVRPAHDDLKYIHDRSPMFIPDALASDWMNAATPDVAMELLQAIELPVLHAEPVAGPVQLA